MISDVIDRLDACIAEAKTQGSRMGYFPALYRHVTVEVERRIAADDFDDGARMARLVEVFANRYLDARAGYLAGRPGTDAWRLAFDSTDDWWPLVLQHLLLGMNAHINLDLGVAAARVAPGSELAGLRRDFGRINEVLASLVDGVQSDLASIWPLLKILDHTAARTDEAILDFAMARARDQAWALAQRLAPLEVAEQEAVIRDVDTHVTAIGRRVRSPGLWIGTLLRVVRVGELGSVRHKIEVLERTVG